METLSCSSPTHLKRKSDDVQFEETKRPKLSTPSPPGDRDRDPAAEPEPTNNNYKTMEEPEPEVEPEEESYGSDSERSAETMAAMRDEMFQKYQPWLLATYGDNKKTKTITLKKYDRIVRTLYGLIPVMAENSKFRFWIRTKGFCLGPPDSSGKQELFVATPRVSTE